MPKYAADGRSPRARGRLQRGRHGSRLERSIPACAGETQPPAESDLSRGVDPRVRGGDSRSSSYQSTPSGRSPRARGRLQAAGWWLAQVWSIPACAGETDPPSPYIPTYRVDPRVRGGDRIEALMRDVQSGRSPRARGRLKKALIASERPRSIPACAGETPEAVVNAALNEVDPRVRGGDSILAGFFATINQRLHCCLGCNS